MAKRLMEEDDEDTSSMAESADHSVDEDSVMEDSEDVGPVRVNGVAH